MIRFKQILTPGRSLVNMLGDSKRRILEQITNLVARELPEFDTQTVFENLVVQEELGSTGFGDGIAIPHRRLFGCQNPIGAVLYLDAPVGFDALGGTPVDLLFILLVPEVAAERHLELFRQIATMLDRADIRGRLCSAPTAEAFYQIVVDVQNGQ